jgi:fatty acid desaturase
VTRAIKILALAIGLTAFILLAIFGFAVWVFIPLLPAAIVFYIAVLYARRRATAPAPEQESDIETRKAA